MIRLWIFEHLEVYLEESCESLFSLPPPTSPFRRQLLKRQRPPRRSSCSNRSSPIGALKKEREARVGAEVKWSQVLEERWPEQRNDIIIDFVGEKHEASLKRTRLDMTRTPLWVTTHGKSGFYLQQRDLGHPIVVAGTKTRRYSCVSQTVWCSNWCFVRAIEYDFAVVLSIHDFNCITKSLFQCALRGPDYLRIFSPDEYGT